jgi:hypothetical protein
MFICYNISYFVKKCKSDEKNIFVLQVHAGSVKEKMERGLELFAK